MELQSQLHTQSRELAEKQHALQMANAVLKEKVDWEGERSRGKGGGETCHWEWRCLHRLSTFVLL